MAVYFASKDNGYGNERFVGIFTSLEKANEMCKLLPFSNDIRIYKVDTDKLYLTPMNLTCPDINSCVQLGEFVDKVNGPDDYNIDEINKLSEYLHKNGDLEGYLKDNEFVDDNDDLYDENVENKKFSPILLKFIGAENNKTISRVDIVNSIVKYIKDHKLLDECGDINFNNPGGKELADLLGVNTKICYKDIMGYLVKYFPR